MANDRMGIRYVKWKLQSELMPCLGHDGSLVSWRLHKWYGSANNEMLLAKL